MLQRVFTNLVDQREIFIKILDEDSRLDNIFKGHFISHQYLFEVLYDLSRTILDLLNTLSVSLLCAKRQP